MKELMIQFIKEEDGISTIEIGVILAVMIALAVVFRKQLTNIWDKIAADISPDKIDTQSDLQTQ